MISMFDGEPMCYLAGCLTTKNIPCATRQPPSPTSTQVLAVHGVEGLRDQLIQVHLEQLLERDTLHT